MTAIKSRVSVALDDTDIPRHISHLRRVPEKKAENNLAEMVVDFDEEPDENILEMVEEAAEVEENVENISITRYPMRYKTSQQRFRMTEKIEPAYKN